MSTPAGLVVQTYGPVTVATLRESSILDLGLVERIRVALEDLVVNQGRTKLVVDFAAVQQLSSSALGMLIRLSSRAKTVKGDVVLCGINAELMKMIKITKLNKLFRIEESESRALRSFGVTSVG
jgi:anti-anti-sigma factor